MTVCPTAKSVIRNSLFSVQKSVYLVRKHHCRCCGAVVCSDCSSHRLIFSNGIDTAYLLGYPYRVCSRCFVSHATSNLNPKEHLFKTDSSLSPATTNNSTAESSSDSIKETISEPNLVEASKDKTVGSTETFHRRIKDITISQNDFLLLQVIGKVK